MDKVKGMLFPGAGGGDDNSADGVPWWMKYLGKAAGITAGVGRFSLCIIYGWLALVLLCQQTNSWFVWKID